METGNLIGYQYKEARGNGFRAIDPSTGNQLPGDFYTADSADVDSALNLAEKAAAIYRYVDKKTKAAFLRSIAEGITNIGDELVERAMAETGLPQARLQGERGRTTGQLNMFADLVEEGSWVEAVIDNALPDRQPAARPDIRKMLIPVGPVVVFGASNFPLAFSVAGGDTASALAAGCPVIVKVHPAHPGTSALVAEAIKKAAQKHELPEGVFSILYDNGYTIGEALVKHPKTKIVTFTGSFKGGTALLKMAQQRDQPIPVFAEMGSVNPVILLPDALESRYNQIAEQYASSITLGAGQFCTNPGLLIAMKSSGLEKFKKALGDALAKINSSTMLTPGICKNYSALSAEMLAEQGVSIIGKGNLNNDKANQAQPIVATVSASSFLVNPKLKEEVFGPYSLLVEADFEVQLQQVLDDLQGQLTASIVADDTDLVKYKSLIQGITSIAGRVMLNNVPTGVEVLQAMQHGGPFPATSDSRFTSVGTGAIKRFVRPVSWQNWSNDLLPDELKNGNPLKIWRLVDNKMSKE
ncbi:aldehyde dehydrogenase (NADP(+)) [Mucilaginibacter sp. McL0603]|uniref:aldehyde dehydrogenase (NADP(+)) n=1 Tax=Mucilaginibacter sp. McL0603 TaxID=3415670 RepID=UPI003CF1F06E